MSLQYDEELFRKVKSYHNWKRRFLEFIAYVKRYRRYPTKATAPMELYRWYQRQKVSLKENRLTEDHRALLRQIGIKPTDMFRQRQDFNKQWYIMFDRYRKWSKHREDTKIEPLRKSDKKLYHWAKQNRLLYKGKSLKYKNGLNQVKMNLLDRIGFYPGESLVPFKLRYHELWMYKRRYGTTHVSWAHTTGAYNQLGRWVNSMRCSRRKGTLEQHKIAALDELGFIWDMETYKFQQIVDRLKAFYDEFGHFDVPRKYNHQLSLWVANIRSRGIKGEERKRILDEIGFEWRNKTARGWDRKTSN